MPIGIVSDDDLQLELEKLSGTKKVVPSPLPPVVEIMERPGRDQGDVNVPDSLRKIIGEEAVLNGRQNALGLAGMFGISPSSVSAYANGATSTASYDAPKPSITSHLNKSRARAVKRASKTLNAALESLTQEKLDYTDAKDLSGIAKDMSVIIKNLEPQQESKSEGDAKQTPQFVIFAPQFRSESSFEVIDVKE